MPTFVFTAPDGREIEVTGPEGATVEQAFEIAQAEFAKRPLQINITGHKQRRDEPETVAQKAKAAAGELGRSTANTLAGIAEGAASIFDMGAEAIGGGAAMALRGIDRLAGGGGEGASALERAARDLERPLTLSRMIRSVVPVPADGLGRGVRTVANALGGVATGVGGGAGLAKAAQPGTLSRLVGAELAARPGAQVASGATGAAAMELAGAAGAPVPVQLAAGLAGGVVAPTATDAGAKGASLVRDALAGQRTRQAAGALLRESVGDETALNSALRMIDEAAVPQPSGAIPTTAEASRDAGLAGLQRSLTSTGVQSGARIGERLTSNAVARQAAANQAFGPGDPNTVQRHAISQAGQAEQAIAEAIERVGPAAYVDESGARAREALGGAFEEAKGRTRAAYNAPALAEVTPVTVPREVFEDIVARARAFYGDGGGEMPAEVQRIIADLAEEGATTRTLANIDRRLADFSGSARVAGRGQEAGFANSLRGVLGEFMDGAMPSAQRDALQAARQARAAQGEVFETGGVGAVLRNDKFGRSVVPDSGVGQRLFPKGRYGADAGHQLIVSVGQEQAEAIAREEMRRLLENGERSVRRVNSLANDYREALRHFPGLRQDFEVARQRAALAETFQRSPLGRMADPARDPSREIGRLLDAGDGARGLRRLASQVSGSPDALKGFRRSMAEYIERKARTNAVDAAGNRLPANSGMLNGLDNILSATNGTAALTPPQRKVLTGLREELAGAQFAMTANRTPGSDTARNAGVAARLAKWAARAADPSVGGISLLDLVINTFDNSAQVHQLAVDAMLNPKLAAELMRTPSPERLSKVLARRLQSSTQGTVLGTAATD